MKPTSARWIARLTPFVPLLVLGSAAAWARVGSGEGFDSGRSNDDSDGDGLFIILRILLELAFTYPKIGVPLLIIFAAWVIYARSQRGSVTTRKALDRAESERRTTTSAGAVQGWVNALKAKDPAFELLPFFDRTKTLFLDVQEAWFRRDLQPVRAMLSDATYQRLVVQLRLMHVQGLRDAIADAKVIDLQLLGLEQNEHFDVVHVRVKAQLRDTDVAANMEDAAARAEASKKPPEAFTEVWSFVRKPGVQTKAGVDAAHGKCPNCGADFTGGAANRCEYCQAIVNSGHYDWVLAEITQGSEHVLANGAVDGLARLRQTDPALSTELLEDRASLVFWKWVEAQVMGDAGRLAKVASPELVEQLRADLNALAAEGKKKVFLEATVGAANLRSLTSSDGVDFAHVELRWSARLGVVPQNQPLPKLPSVPNRWVLTLTRRAGAQTPAASGVSTSRCPSCGAPLSDNGQTSCEFCATPLASGERDWVLTRLSTWEGFRGVTPMQPRVAPRVPDREERERLVYIMAAVAAADGTVDARERALLKDCATRFGVPWANVELALGAGPQVFEKLIVRGSVEADAFLAELVQLALVDGKVDRKERQLLESAAKHLGAADKLDGLLRASG